MKRLSFTLLILMCASVAYGATRLSQFQIKTNTGETGETGEVQARMASFVKQVVERPTAPAASTTPVTSATSKPEQNVTSATSKPQQVTTSNKQSVTGKNQANTSKNSALNNAVSKNSAQRRSRSAITTTTQTADARSVGVGRAAKQSVIGTGTKVKTAAQNTAVDQACWEKFGGCMDAFCMLDNASGGRCICSDKNAEYDTILMEIQKLDEQSYQLATVGVERIEMGEDADLIMSKADAIADSVTANGPKSKRQVLDLSSWNSIGTDSDGDIEDIFTLSSDGNSITEKTGDALYRASVKLCQEQVPECQSQFSMMELIYKQNIRSDCVAYENSLRQSRTQSAQKLAAAQSAMREAALEQYQNANKYDLGQCTVRFKECMQTTGECGEDFMGCVDLAARANSEMQVKASKAQQYTIKGTISNITITAETYDTLNAKKELCMYVTKECVNVRDKVWDAFLREAAPQIKSAELSVESDMRTSCISNISDCFQKACKDTMDPNDPEGSYDMCLTRPDTVRSLCKVQIDPCEKAEPNIMSYVLARLKSMRVDSCTKEFKDCLQSEDRCGKDYAGCVGLSADAIVDLCPVEKLTGCSYEKYSYGKDNKSSVTNIKAELTDIAQGILLSIDNSLLTVCQKALQSKLVEVCGSVSECQAFEDNDVIGTDSLVRIMDTRQNQIIIDGLMNVGLLELETDNNGKIPDIKKIGFSDISFVQSMGDGEDNALEEADEDTKQRIRSAVGAIRQAVQRKVDVLLADETLNMCVSVRDERWRGTGGAATDRYARFPNLLDSAARMILGAALDKAYLNYNKKFNELVLEATEDQNDDIKTALCVAIGYKPECKKWNSNLYRCDGYAHNGLTDIFGENVGKAGLRNGGTRYVVSVADLANKMDATSMGIGEFVMTDKDDNMLGSITTQSVYSPTTNTCTLTTTSLFCEDMKTIITTDTDKCTNVTITGLGGGCSSGGLSTFGVSNKTVTTQEYHGKYCSKYGESTTEVTEIKM